ncbi:HAD hydrolase family protein, partial [Spirillospora sp. NPDC049652]
GATKGAALRELAAARGVPLAEVAAIGDNPNDIDMIRAAGTGVAVGDGHPDVLAAADVVVAACAVGAVADLVDRVLA